MLSRICKPCALLPELVKTCPCGKQLLASISKKGRMSCLDTIPTCEGICDKKLNCKLHKCNHSCHNGACPPCSVSFEEKCRCGTSARLTECYKIKYTLEDFRILQISQDEKKEFLCKRVCKQKKKCNKHICGRICCDVEKIGIDEAGHHLCLLVIRNSFLNLI